MSNVTKRTPASQFIVVLRSKDTIGLRSFISGGKLLQINRRMEFVFASHSFNVWESRRLEGSLEECRLVNCRHQQAVLGTSDSANLFKKDCLPDVLQKGNDKEMKQDSEVSVRK